MKFVLHLVEYNEFDYVLQISVVSAAMDSRYLFPNHKKQTSLDILSFAKATHIKFLKQYCITCNFY